MSDRGLCGSLGPIIMKNVRTPDIAELWWPWWLNLRNGNDWMVTSNDTNKGTIFTGPYWLHETLTSRWRHYDVTMTSFLSVQNHQYDTKSLASSDPFGSGSDSVGHNRNYSEMRWVPTWEITSTFSHIHLSSLTISFSETQKREILKILKNAKKLGK